MYHSKPAVDALELYFRRKMDQGEVEKHLRGSNSKLPIIRWGYLRSGVIVIQRTA